MTADKQKKIIILTPTYSRTNRMRYLSRCVSVFKKRKNLLWVVVEDGSEKDREVELFLKTSGVESIYLSFGPTRCWGNAQRNYGLTYIRDHHLEGIIYLADDDNYYSPRLFKEIAKTKKVSIFPVGNLGPRGIERPIVKSGKIIDWDAHWTERKYPIDMAAFAFHSSFLRTLDEPLWNFLPQDKRRGGESEFMDRLIRSVDDLEILCQGCTQCYVWHDQPLGEDPIWTPRLRKGLLFIPRSIRQWIKKKLRGKNHQNK